jgi:hypothetical protein
MMFARDMTGKVALSITLLLATSAFAQQPSAPAVSAAPSPLPGQAPLQIPDPHYVTVPMTIDVNAPADKVWARIGKFCDIGEWTPSAGGNTCKYLAGDGDVGSVRSVANEVMVAKTKYSYTYAQAPRVGAPYNLYHGTLEVVPVAATTSRLSYVLFFDDSMLADDAAREKNVRDREAAFNQRLRNMKTLAEGGTLPVPEPAAPRPAGSGTAPAPYLSPNPHYVAVPMQIEVNAPADVVWAHIGHYCDLAKLGQRDSPHARLLRGAMVSTAPSAASAEKCWLARRLTPTPTRSPCARLVSIRCITALSRLAPLVRIRPPSTGRSFMTIPIWLMTPRERKILPTGARGLWQCCRP